MYKLQTWNVKRGMAPWDLIRFGNVKQVKRVSGFYFQIELNPTVLYPF